jgi:hypothetical protein
MYPINGFNLQAFLDVAGELLRSDETLLALEFLDRFWPGFYRDNVPPEVIQLKHDIMARIATSSFYATHQGFELTVSDEDCSHMGHTLRAILISADIKILNANGYTPHVYDHGPGEGSLPLVLKKEGCKFTYEQAYVNHPTYEATKHRFEDVEAQRSPDQPTIWVATEIMEHLHEEKEIRYEMQNRCGLADLIHVSTPLYTFNPNVMDWRSIGWLGHLRTYTPGDFREVIRKMFPEYNWTYYQSHVQHARLFNGGSKFDCIKVALQIQTPDQKAGPDAEVVP